MTNEVYIYDRGYFWTGKSWTEVLQFAKKLTILEALEIKNKRFNRRKPPIRIRLCKDFEKKKKPYCDLSHSQRRARKQ